MTAREIIRSNRERVGITSDKMLMEEAGIPYSTYTHERAKDEGSYLFREARSIIEITKMPFRDALSWLYGREITMKELTEQLYGKEVLCVKKQENG